MIYQVMLSENQSVLIENVERVEHNEDTIIFKGMGGFILAAFKMYNIMGFFRMDMPNQKADTPQWDFELLEKYSADYQEKERIKIREAAEKKSKGWTDTYAAVMKEAEHIYNSRDVSFHEIHESLNEAGYEALERGGLVIAGGTIPLIARNILKTLLKDETDHYEIEHLEKLLKRNINDCLGVTN